MNKTEYTQTGTWIYLCTSINIPIKQTLRQTYCVTSQEKVRLCFNNTTKLKLSGLHKFLVVTCATSDMELQRGPAHHSQ